MIEIALSAVLLTLCFLNILAHTIGLYPLTYLYKNGGETPQMVLIINLSFVECMTNVFLSLIYFRFFNFLLFHDEVTVYFDMLLHSNINIVYYLTKMYIIIDKFLEVWLNLKYQLHCTVKRAKYLIICTWIFGFILFTVAIIVYTLQGYLDHIPVIYIFSSLNFIFIILAIGLYSFIFHKYRLSRMNPVQNTNASNQSLFYVFRHSRF